MSPTKSADPASTHRPRLGGALALIALLCCLSAAALSALSFDAQAAVQAWLGGTDGVAFVPGEIDRDRISSAVALQHTGDDGPCLRAVPEVEQSRLDAFEEVVAAAGLSERFVENGFFTGLLWKWNFDWEEDLHETGGEAEGVLQAISQEVGAWDRFQIWLHHDALIEALGGGAGEALAEQARVEESELSTHEAANLRSAWTSCRACTTPRAMMRLMDPMRRRVTVTRIERIRACLEHTPAATSLLDLRCVDEADLSDAWLGDIRFERASSELVSLGADGEEGGAGWDEDIRRGIGD